MGTNQGGYEMQKSFKQFFKLWKYDIVDNSNKRSWCKLGSTQFSRQFKFPPIYFSARQNPPIQTTAKQISARHILAPIQFSAFCLSGICLAGIWICGIFSGGKMNGWDFFGMIFNWWKIETNYAIIKLRTDCSAV